jgi:putative 4-mercaptohistidine N1-methyltranferase
MPSSAKENNNMSDLYETDRLLAEYLLFHFGRDEDVLTIDADWPAGMKDALGFPLRTTSHFGTAPVARGLDLGCAVGRSTWEMARTCSSVIGIDFSESFIRTANTLREGTPVPYPRLEEAHRTTMLVAAPPHDISPSPLSFEQGDAMNLRADLGTFERVHAANLLCRLSDPVKLLHRLPSLVTPGGTLVLATPCTWLEEFTPPHHWPGTDTKTWLMDHLSLGFDLVHTTDEPFLIRETARKFQWTRSLVTVWRRRLES